MAINRDGLQQLIRQGEVIEDLDLSKMDLSHLHLGGANFSECNFEGANFTHCKIEQVSFLNCQLTNSTFNNSVWVDVNTIESDLSNSKFE
jgi:uncharacterized protein YjbI with pentapeptide repeats